MTSHLYIKSHQNLHTSITLCLPKLSKFSLIEKLRTQLVTSVAYRYVPNSDIVYTNADSSSCPVRQLTPSSPNGDNRCLCNVCAGGAQSNNSVGGQHSDVVISDC